MISAASLTPLTSAQNLDLTALTFGPLALCLIFVTTRAARVIRSTLHIPSMARKAADPNQAASGQAGQAAPGKDGVPEIMLTSRMGQGQWDFSQSFATNIGIIGSVLTLMLSSNILPSTTVILPSTAYSGLAIFFGSLVIIAPLLYNGTAKRVPLTPNETADTAAEYHGMVWGFLLAALLTEWGLAGSVVTVFVTLLELYKADSLSAPPLILMAIVLFASLIFLGRYCWVKMGGTLADQFDPEHEAVRSARSAAIAKAVSAEYGLPQPTGQEAPKPRWTLLLGAPSTSGSV